jgi:hypothetical protein
MKEKKNIPAISINDLSKVENPLLNEKQLNMLLAETPPAHIYERPAKGGGKWSYVTGIYVNKVLNMIFGWDVSFEVKQFEYNLQTKQAVVLGRLTCNIKGRSIVKEQFGRSDIAFKKGTEEPLDLGNDLKAAATDALKKCASQIGVASDIYGPDEFKQIRVVGATDSEQIEVLQKKISEQMAFCQDPEMIEVIKDKLLEAEAHGTNTLDFYSEILSMFV